MRFIQGLTFEIASMAAVFCLLAAMEIAFPREQQSTRGRLQGATFWALAAPVNVGVPLVFYWLARRMGLHTLFTVDLTWLPLGLVVGPLIAAIVGDFFFYWMHRAQHVFFWRFHAVHHSIEELNAVSSYHHVSEALFRTLCITTPSILFFTEVRNAEILAYLLPLQGAFLHSCTRVNFGPLRYLVGDNRFHRIHHSLEQQHFGRNYSGFTPIWDVVFGTAYFPARDEWPATGLADAPEPSGMIEFVSRPFVKPARGLARASRRGRRWVAR